MSLISSNQQDHTTVYYVILNHIRVITSGLFRYDIVLTIFNIMTSATDRHVSEIMGSCYFPSFYSRKECVNIMTIIIL